MRNEFKLHQLHVDKTSYTPIAVVKEEDNVTLNLELFKDNIPLSLTGQTITLSALRSDKVIVEQTTGFTISNTNRLNIKLKNNVICKSGIVYLELTLTDSTGSMTTLDFYLKVNRKILGHESIQGSDNIASLEKIQQDFINSSNALLETVTENENTRVDAEGTRKLNEEIRGRNETSRSNAETKRVEAENLRKTAETSRDEAEKIRAAADALRDEKIDEFGSQVTKIENELKSPITTQKTDFVISYRNLFNKNAVTHDMAIATDHSETNFNIEPFPGEVLTDFIPVFQLREYSSRCIGNRIFYDKDKQPILKNSFKEGKTFTTPQNCYFIRYNFTRYVDNIDRLETEMLIEKAAFDLIGDKYIHYTNEELLSLKNNLMDFNKNKPNGYLELNDNGVVDSKFIKGYSTSNEMIVDDSNENITYMGDWTAIINDGDNSYNETRHNSRSAGDYLEYTFYGTCIEAFDYMYPNRGIIEVFVDDESYGIFDRYSKNPQKKQKVFSINGLALKNHTLKIVLLEEVNDNHTDVLSGKTGADINRVFSFDYFLIKIEEKFLFQDTINKFVTEKNQNLNLNFWVGTQKEYDSLTTKDMTTLYFIKDNSDE